MLITVGSSAALPSVTDPSDMLELQPNGQLFDFNAGTDAPVAPYDNLASYVPGVEGV